ncbi:UDP-N-acetylmuramoyl-tripeptide--D-alanyl-D-alanine ligase [Secundilactobacillus paracollinoides]|uniref:UDP-N-acetylmuramoyl-tripeptide--D-alanyl-D- alanine ligase n=1 Tax=Secundilactobacillus paracollinoides TaxID=240427 RepID=UPI00081A5380|nr:UDP-N-acetylmuramoyl-tripeptide--D-alanyl-D-alanine ligase [Secundilactobacillus paracollinoides]ANZ59984.1 UDP-N-acetylmuramoyl-tripeptide--D-alanyl-D-alanine ligase [Secundilactobacillus paracollinoides]ANZ63061.1 UDP-N-acetylmuramoyl-tripeptide--D-alanyl-D-alanine ligase [Secundilactobacillus paracollinoides]
MKMQLSEIAGAVSAQNDITDWQTVEISSVAFDSRELKPGALFVPLVGERDGHKFIDKAIENGAAAIFWQADHGEAPTNVPVIVVDDALKALQALSKHYLLKINPRVVAITGSNGKTTTKDMVASILATQFNVTKTQDNFNNEIGVPITILSMEPNTEMLVVEMGMDRPGQLDFLSRLVAPDVAIITMIGEAHIEFFGTRDKIADAKMEIVNGLKDDGLFIFDGDEPLLQERAKTVSQRQLTFGHSKEDDLNVTAMTPTSVNTTFTTNVWPDTTFEVPMIGDYNVNNALAALCVARTYRVAPEKSAAALLNLDLTRNRAEWLQGSQGEQILSDVYNSNPTAVKEVMAAFSKTPVDGRRLVVLGDMLELGEQSDALHAGLSPAFDPDVIDSVYLVGPHMHALYDRLATTFDADKLHFYQVDELGTLSADLLATLTAKDAILIKGSHGIHLESVLATLRTTD